MRVVPSAVMKRAVILAGVVVIEIVIAIVLVPSTDHARIETTDFLNFYVGATIVREGHGRTLYQAETQQLALQSILEAEELPSITCILHLRQRLSSHFHI